MGEQQIQEIGANGAGAPQVSEAERLEASTRRITLQPLHEDIVPDQPAEDEASNVPANMPAIANSPLETEATVATAPAGAAVPVAPDHARRTALTFSILIMIVLGIFAGVMLVSKFPL